jgi:hypothetical protein
MYVILDKFSVKEHLAEQEGEQAHLEHLTHAQGCER